jgi:hypothetical protein
LHTFDEPLTEEQRAALLKSCDESQELEIELLRMLLRELPHYRKEVRVPWLGKTLWLVAPDSDQAIFARKGVQRGRIWTVSEAVDLFRVLNYSPAVVHALAKLKCDADLEVVGWVEEEPPRKPPSWYCLSTYSWESIHGATACALCHPPAAPHLVKQWLDKKPPSNLQTLRAPLEVSRATSRKVRRETTWTVYRTKNGTLDAHHIMMASYVDLQDVVARVPARYGATAIETTQKQLTRGP